MSEIKPKYVTFKQAKWLKDKGFDVPVIFPYVNGEIDFDRNDLKDGSELYINYNYRYNGDSLDIRGEIFSAPEQWQVVDWLLENHGIWVLIDITDTKDLCNYVIKWRSNICLNENRGNGYKNPQEAYLAAFDYIKENNLI